MARRCRALVDGVDRMHSNIVRHWPGEMDWPTDEQRAALRAADRLDEAPKPDVQPRDGAAELEFNLLTPCIVRLRLVPDRV